MTTETTPATSTSENISEKPTTPETPPVTSTSVPAEAPPADIAKDTSLPAWLLKADYVILALILLLSFFVSSFAANNSDLWMNLAAGKRLSEGTMQLGVDPFSWASATKEGEAADWVFHSWLYSWIVFQLYQLVGGAGLVFAKALLVVVAIFLLSRIGWHESSRWFTLITLALAVLAMSLRLEMQPIVVSLLFLSITLYLLYRAGVFVMLPEESQPTDPRWLWGLPPLFALWANMDHWFILGPMIVGLCWAATGLARWFKSAGVVPGKTLGLVFGVGLLACLLNPFHVRVFQLPPELAYMLVSFTESLGLTMPDSVVAGGRTLKEMRRIDPELATWTVSSLSDAYWSKRHMGLNIGGLALYPLLLLGLLGFTMVSLVKPQENAPTLHMGRFLLWLVFGVMSLALYRMIPFFALVAAPLTAVTLGEFLQWQRISSTAAAKQRDRGMGLARFATIPFILLLLFFTWPGWLHGNFEFNSPRRVAWDVRPEPSQVQAALTLKELKDKGECENVFNSSFALGNYLSWYAPDVKYGMDTRFSLYAQTSARYAKARQALGNIDKPEEDWRDLFEEKHIDQVAFANYLQSGILFKFWLGADRWRPRYVDTRNVVVSWSGTKKTWPVDYAVNDANRLAFGPVPLDQRPPLNGMTPPQTLTFWTLYLDGIEQQPLGVAQAKMIQAKYSFHNQFFHTTIMEAGPVSRSSLMAFAGSLTLLQGTPDASVLPSFLTVFNDFTMFQNRDNGPPALPILMVRAARRAVAENPHDTQAHLTLLEVNEMMRRNQEDRWANVAPNRPHPAKLRDRIRQLQYVAHRYNVLQITPDSFEANHRIAEVYMQQNLYDLALEHMQIAAKGLEMDRATTTEDPRKVDAQIKQYNERVKSFENAVKLRVAKFKENSANLPPLKQAEYAYGGVFQDLVKDRQVNTPLGLGKKALEILLALKAEKLAAEDQIGNAMLRFELLLAMGRVDVVMANLKEKHVRDGLPPLMYAQYQLLAGGAIGDYAAMDEGAAELEKHFQKEWQDRRLHAIHFMFLSPTLQAPSTVGVGQALRSIRSVDGLHAQNNELCNLITLRGILALESGETAKARAFFQAALDQAGTEYGFTERPIAVRYLELLDAQRKK